MGQTNCMFPSLKVVLVKIMINTAMTETAVFPGRGHQYHLISSLRITELSKQIMITMLWWVAVTTLMILHIEKSYTSWSEANHAGPTSTKVNRILSRYHNNN